MHNAIRTELNSKCLKAAAYCFQKALLELEFRSGAVYRFAGVPETTYGELLRAESKGGYFHHHIRNRFPHVKIELSSREIFAYQG
jgi:hypothetical protein